MTLSSPAIPRGPTLVERLPRGSALLVPALLFLLLFYVYPLAQLIGASLPAAQLAFVGQHLGLAARRVSQWAEPVAADRRLASPVPSTRSGRWRSLRSRSERARQPAPAAPRCRARGWLA